MISTIRKRDGKLVPYDNYKIANAILRLHRLQEQKTSDWRFTWLRMLKNLSVKNFILIYPCG